MTQPLQGQSAGLLGQRGDAPLLSVIVATCNGADRLPRLLDALARQTVSGQLPHEIVLVDNRSTDDTAKVVSRLAERSLAPIVYVYEGRQGKSYALNAGIGRARGSIIALTDDDGIPAPDWLEQIIAYFDAHPDVPCIGGRVELFDQADARVTVRQSLQPQEFELSGFSATNIPVIGCNLAFRSATLRMLGPYDPALGPGSRVGVSEDVDMLYRLLLTGGRVAYVPALLVYHNHGRRTEQAVGRVLDDYLFGRGGFYCKYLLRCDARVARWAWWELAGLVKVWLRRGVISKNARAAMRTLALICVGAGRYLCYGHWLGKPAWSPDDRTTRAVS